MRRLGALLLSIAALALPLPAPGQAILAGGVYPPPAMVATGVGGFGQTASGSSFHLTVASGTYPAGSLMVVWGATTVGSATGVSDGLGNIYTGGTAISTSDGISIRPFYSIITTAVANGANITVTFSSSSTKTIYIDAVGVTNPALASPLDVQAAGTVATGTAPSIATGSLVRANEIVFGYTMISGGAADSYTEAPGFAAQSGAILTGAGALRVADDIVNSVSSVTYSSIMGTSRNYAANVIAFKGQ